MEAGATDLFDSKVKKINIKIQKSLSSIYKWCKACVFTRNTKYI